MYPQPGSDVSDLQMDEWAMSQLLPLPRDETAIHEAWHRAIRAMARCLSEVMDSAFGGEMR